MAGLTMIPRTAEFDPVSRHREGGAERPMLVQLSVRNVATLAEVDLELPGGLVVFTGETGAGKSLLVESLRFALGGRGRGALIREGADRAEVCAVFRLPETHPVHEQLALAELIDPDDPNQLVLRRIVRPGGRSVFQINGVPVPVRTLEPFRPLLVDLTSQHEHVRLLDPQYHREVIDGLPRVRDHLSRYRDQFAVWREREAELDELESRKRERAERLDYLSYLLDECDRLDPRPNEEPYLEAEWRRMCNAEEIRASAAQLYDVLEDGDPSVDSLLSSAAGVLRTLSRLDPDKAAEFTARLDALHIELQDLAGDVRTYGEEIEADANSRAEMEDRLEGLRKLRKRFGCTPDELLDCIDVARKERAELDTIETQTTDAANRAAEARAKLDAVGKELADARKRAAPGFIQSVEERLARLQMPNAKLDIMWQPLDQPGPFGLDDVRIHAQTNPGEGFHPLDTIASGGELSRLLLAIKPAMENGDVVLSTVFDEVDTGIGGAAAMAVGGLMKEVAAGRQVLCVSHLPQIAAAADHHFHVVKDVRDGRTFTRVVPVTGKERLDVLSQMLGGETTEAALAHAEELIRRVASPA